MSTATTLTGRVDRLEVNPDVGPYLDDEVYAVVRLKVSSDTEKHTADGDARTVALTVRDVTVLEAGTPLERVARLALVSAAATRDRAAGKPPLEHDGESVDGTVEADLEEAVGAVDVGDEDLERLETELLGGPAPDDDLELEGEGEEAPAGEVGPFDAGEVELDEDGVTPPASRLDEDVARTDAADPDGRYLAVDGKTISTADLEAARARVVAAFGTDYVDEPSTAMREDLLGIEHVAAWLLRDLRVVEQAAGARAEVLEYLDGRLATTLERYAEEEPWKGYKGATVDTVLGALDRQRPTEEERGNWPELAERVIAYETDHKGRKGILDVVEALLEPIPAAEVPAPDPDFEPTEDPAGEEADR
jgi:hypothetical protein